MSTPSRPNSERPLLVQFGAGSIGRSLVGQLFSRAGWAVVFIDIDDKVVAALNTRRSYRIEIKDDLLPGEPEMVEIGNVSGISLADRDAVISALTRADLVGISVGAANLESACVLLAQALPMRSGALPVLLCENLHDAGKVAGKHIGKYIKDAGEMERRVFFIEAAISKMVPTVPESVRKSDPLVVWAEAYNTLYLDADAYPGIPPVVPGVAWRSDFAAYVDRKLFLHNFGHAATAYLGHLAGKTELWQCMEDARIRAEAAGCMMEASRALALRYPGTFTFDENRAWMDDLLRRFGNRSLGDTVFRVGRDLKRKYAYSDRMIGTLRLLRDEKTGFRYTARAVAAGLFFGGTDEHGVGHPGDADIVAAARREGVEEVLVSIGGLDPGGDAEIIDAVAAEYARLRGSLLPGTC